MPVARGSSISRPFKRVSRPLTDIANLIRPWPASKDVKQAQKGHDLIKQEHRPETPLNRVHTEQPALQEVNVLEDEVVLPSPPIEKDEAAFFSDEEDEASEFSEEGDGDRERDESRYERDESTVYDSRADALAALEGVAARHRSDNADRLELDISRRDWPYRNHSFSNLVARRLSDVQSSIHSTKSDSLQPPQITPPRIALRKSITPDGADDLLSVENSAVNTSLDAPMVVETCPTPQGTQAKRPASRQTILSRPTTAMSDPFIAPSSLHRTEYSYDRSYIDNEYSYQSQNASIDEFGYYSTSIQNPRTWIDAGRSLPVRPSTFYPTHDTRPRIPSKRYSLPLPTLVSSLLNTPSPPRSPPRTKPKPINRAYVRPLTPMFPPLSRPASLRPQSSNITLCTWDEHHLPAPGSNREKPYKVSRRSFILPTFALGGGRFSGQWGDQFGAIERKVEPYTIKRPESLREKVLNLGRRLSMSKRGGKDEMASRQPVNDMGWVTIE